MALLTVGSRGDSVKSLQQQLANQGYKLAVDGIYGAQTKSAVTEYQRKSGLTVDGIAGNQTMGSLSKLSSPAPQQTAQPAPQPAPAAQPSTPSTPYSDNPEVQAMDNYAKQQADSQVSSATAQLDAKLASDTAALKQAYEQAVADGNISVRDAEAQFQEQKALLEKQAYQDSQRTGLYGQEMGIQNSQQQIGLMQGDQARNASLVNKNVSERDRRINDVKDRISAITKQKDLDLARVQSEHDSGIIQAKSEANANYSNNMMGVYKDTYNYNNSLKQLQEQSRLQIEQMNVQHGLDLDTMAKQLENSIALEQKKYGLQSALQSQAAKQAQQSAIAKATAEMQAEQQAYERDRQRALAKYTDANSPEFKIWDAQRQAELKDSISKTHAATIYDATAKSVLNDPLLTSATPEKPSGYFFNMIQPTQKTMDTYDKAVQDKKDAIARKNAFLKDPAGYLGY